jgi:hypothetical protein
MTRDKQLREIKLQAVRRKCAADQALNIKEFAVAAGISYSVARAWFQTTGFPQLHGKIFWQDFVLWRRARCVKGNVPVADSVASGINDLGNHAAKPDPQWPPRAAKILAEMNSSRTTGR